MSDNVLIQGVDTVKFDDKHLGLGIDRRPLKEKYKRFFSTVSPLIWASTFLFLSLMFNFISEIALILCLLNVFSWLRKRSKFLIESKEFFDKPKYINYDLKKSLNDWEPKTDKVSKGNNGTFFFGHEINTGQEVHASDDKIRTHLIIFGTTGAGKTETILSMCVNFLVQSSGFILVDGKGDNVLFAKAFAICYSFGRVDDIYLLNFMNNKQKYGEKSAEDITNTFNFFVGSTASEVDQIVGGLLPNTSEGGLWEGRATSGISAINRALYYLAEEGYIQIDPDVYRGYFKLEQFAELAFNTVIPKPLRVAMVSLLDSISYTYPTEKEPNPKQESATTEQFQYITMQYTETFGMLADQYSHVTVSQRPDISMIDIVLRRRILIVLLPSLAQSKQNVKNLGRIIIALTRNVSSHALGSRVEGNKEIVIDGKVTSAINTFGMIFDEFGTYATVGASTLPAQVRSLNIMCIFAGQDYAAFKSGDEKEADSIFANCTLKLCMKLEDPQETFERFNKSTGEEYVLVPETYEMEDNIISRKYTPEKRSRVEKRPILDIKDLKNQGAGQGVLISGSKTMRIAGFYADPIMPLKARLNHFVEVFPPDKPTADAMRVGVDELFRKFRKRQHGDWQSEEKTLSKMALHQQLYDAINGVNYVDKFLNPELVNNMSETELSLFVLSVYAKKIEIVDKQSYRLTKKMAGIEQEQYDDDLLLNEGLSAMIEGSDDKLMDSSSGGIPDTLQDKKQLIPDTREQLLFEEIDGVLDRKQKILDNAIERSFDSLAELDMRPYELLERLETLENALVKKANKSPKVRDTKRLEKSVARNVVLDLGINTNVAIASDPEEKSKVPQVSSKRVKSVISNIINNEKEKMSHA